MLSSGWRGSISNFAIYLDVPIPADCHTKPGLNVACGLRLGPFEATARSLERYFKSGSGKAFAKKRFLQKSK